MKKEMKQLSLSKIKIIKETAQKYGAKKVSLFGSTVRNEAIENSDIDLLLEMKPGSSLLDLIAIKQDLQDSLHQKVDVVTESSLSPYLRDQILLEAVQL